MNVTMNICNSSIYLKVHVGDMRLTWVHVVHMQFMNAWCCLKASLYGTHDMLACRDESHSTPAMNVYMVAAIEYNFTRARQWHLHTNIYPYTRIHIYIYNNMHACIYNRAWMIYTIMPKHTDHFPF